jgi:hypothetical protein
MLFRKSIIANAYASNKVQPKLFYTLGIGTLIVGLVSIPLFVLLSTLLKEPYEKYDYDKICAEGYQVNAKIKNIVSKANITINGIHPVVISYEYQNANKTESFSDAFQSLDVKGINLLKTNDSIQVYVLNEQSVIKNIKPFSFSLQYFWFVPFLLITLGAIFVRVGRLHKPK